MLDILQQLKEKQWISMADYHFAKLIAEKQKCGHFPPEIQNLAIFLAALCSYQYQKGHTCVSLDKDLLQSAFDLPRSEQECLIDIQNKINYLAISQWEMLLTNHLAFTTTPLDKITPLVIQEGKLYFYRVWQDEYIVASYFARAAKQSLLSTALPEQTTLDSALIQQTLAKYFPQSESDPLPKLAVATALKQAFCLITGGPGTGKTTAVSRLLLVLQDLYQAKLRIKLVAPTGKAAARLTESMQNTLSRLQYEEGLQLDATLLAAIPTQAETLHRLLGVRLFEEQPRFNAKNLLPIDVLVVDEASMVDLSLMAKLLQALPTHCKLILLGDKDQLSSVEAGAILAELGQFTTQGYSKELVGYLEQTTNVSLKYQSDGNPIRDCLCQLLVSRRFGSKPYIGELANRINRMEGTKSWQLFTQYQQANPELQAAEIRLIDFEQLNQGEMEQNHEEYTANCVDAVIKSAVQSYAHYLNLIQQVQHEGVPIQSQISRIFTAFNSVRYLTALRVGALGAEQLNQLIAEELRKKGLVRFEHSRDWYVGKPIMIMQNDSNVGLFNGDIGLYLLEKQGDSWKGKFWFENGKSELASRIPKHEPAFVMTVHKSQGSEFEHAVLVLPTEPNPILSKELVYTGVTRAKSQITVFSDRKIWENALSKQMKRASGLGRLLENLS